MPPAENSTSPPPRRRRRRALASVAIVLVVSVGAVWLGPSILTPVLAKRASRLLGADVRIRWISWDPLVGRLTLHRVAIAPTAGDPAIVTLLSATVDVALRRWLHGEHALDAIVLRRPWISLQRTAAGDFNVTSLFRAVATPPSPPVPADMGPPTPIRIGVFRIQNGSIEFRDETTTPALETSLHLDDATARDLVLASDGSAGLAFHVDSRIENEPLTLDVSYDTGTDTSHVTAKLVAEQASLARALLYVPLGWQRTAGTLDAMVTYERRSEKGRLAHHSIKADLAIHDLVLTEPWADEPMLQAKRVRLPAVTVDLLKQRTELGTVTVDDYRAVALRDEKGVHVPLASGTPENAASSWRTTLDRVALGRGIAVLRNVLAAPEVLVPLKSGTIRLPTDEVTFELVGTVAGGSISLVGRARGDATDLSFTFGDLALAEAAPMVGMPHFAKGRIGGTVDLALGPDETSFHGALSSTDATTMPSQLHPEELTAWQRLDATITAGELDPLRVTLGRVRLVWPYLMVHRRADGIFPFTATATDLAPSPEASPTDATAPWLRIDRLDVEGGRIEFYDSTLPKAYGIDLTNLAAAADGIALSPARVDRLTIRGALDELSPLVVTGRIDPAMTTLDLNIDRLLLPPLNPYLAPALGYEVETGLARIASRMRIEGTTVAADTDLVLARFAMRAAGTDTVGGRIGTPLSVALALMKDTHGDIRLDLPIEGDVAANEYRVGSLLREALGTALLGTLRAPLGFLRGLFGKDEGEQFDLRPVPFRAGSAALDAGGERRIAELARLLERQAALRALLIPAPSRADWDVAVAAGEPRPLEALSRLAVDRGAIVRDALTQERGIASKRVAVEGWVPVEPDIEGEPGVDVQLRTE